LTLASRLRCSPRVLAAQSFRALTRQQHDVSPDGQRFLMKYTCGRPQLAAHHADSELEAGVILNEGGQER
jgi:hypothetical protein